MAEHSLDGLPPIERALRGSLEDVFVHLREIQKANWPHLNVLMYDYTHIQRQRGEPPITREVEGQSVTFNPSVMDTPESTQKKIGQLIDRLAEQSPELSALLREYPQESRTSLTRDFNQLVTMTITPGLKRVQSIMPTADTFGAYMPVTAFIDQGIKEFDTLTLNGDGCTSCTRTGASLRSLHCAEQTPDAARLQQLTRLYIGYHELAHAIDKNGRTTEALSETGARFGKFYEPQVREIIGDGFATLMMVKGLGPEGQAFAQLWEATRSHPYMSLDHQTSGMIRTALDWAQENLQHLAQMTPADLMKQVVKLVPEQALTVHEAMQLDQFRNRLSQDFEGNVLDQPTMAARLQPAGLAQFVRESDLSQSMPDLPTHPPVVQRLIRQLEQRDTLAETARQQLSANNPLNTAQWQAQEAERAQSCSVALEADYLAKARAQLKAETAVNAEPSAEISPEPEAKRSTPRPAISP